MDSQQRLLYANECLRLRIAVGRDVGTAAAKLQDDVACCAALMSLKNSDALKRSS